MAVGFGVDGAVALPAGAYGSTSPTRMAYLVSSVRSRMPSFSKMLERCRSTVLMLIVNRWAISFEEWPSAISLTTSSSLLVKPVVGSASPRRIRSR